MHDPAKIARSQKTQRQDTPATVINPVIMGEIFHAPSEGYTLNNGCFRRLTVGPANGPRAKNDKAFPRTAGSHKSPSRALQQSCKLGAKDKKDGKTYPLLVRGAAAKNPPRKRKISKAAVLGANALPT